MHRVYSNRLPGEERIHVEITREEIREMRARPAGPAARAFWGLLATADHQFTGVTLEDPKSAAPGASPRCVCGDPIERWDGPGEPGWIHSPGSDTRCLAARTAARQTTGQDDTGPAPGRLADLLTLSAPCDTCEHTLNWHRNDVGCTTPACACSQFREPAPAVGQSAEAHDTEARPPRVQWRVEGYDADQWNPLGSYSRDHRDARQRQAQAQRRYPDMPTRVVRETTTWTVEDER